MPTQPNLFKVANHSNLGKDWEKQLEALHDFYRLRRLCDVVKNAERWIFCCEKDYEKYSRFDPGMVARDGKGRPMRRTESDIDFSGGNANFSICFDAKETSADRLSLDFFKPHQVSRLLVSAKCGSVAGFMVKMTKFDRVFFLNIALVDAKIIAKIKQTGRRAKPGTGSFSLSELEENATEIKKSANGQFDWFVALGLHA